MARAIERGSAWLSGASEKERASPRADARVQALALWALSRSGREPSQLGSGLDWLGSQHKWLADPKDWRPPSGTYAASLILLAHAGPGLASELDSGSLRHFRRKKRPGRALRHVVGISARWLVATRSRPGEWGYSVMAPPKVYPPQIPHQDLSNTQFAVYALYEAEVAGVKVPHSVWRQVFKYLIGAQEAKGPRADLSDCAGFQGSPLTRAEKPREPKSRRGQTRTRPGASSLSRLVVNSKTGAQARGWTYGRSTPEATLTMTSAGLSCLSLASARLEARGKLSASDRRRASRALQDGLAWIRSAWDEVEGLPEAGYREGHGPFYTLWSLEKAFDTAGVEVIAGKPAWETLARMTLRLQRPDGSWGPPESSQAGSLIDTSLALLVLSRASLYAFDELGQRPVTGSLERFLAPQGQDDRTRVRGRSQERSGEGVTR